MPTATATSSAPAIRWKVIQRKGQATFHLRKVACPHFSLFKGRMRRRAYARRANVLLVHREGVVLGSSQPTAGLEEEQAARDKVWRVIVVHGNGVSCHQSACAESDLHAVLSSITGKS